MQVSLTDGPAQTSVRAATLRQKLQIIMMMMILIIIIVIVILIVIINLIYIAQTYYLTQSQYNGTGPTSPSSDTTMPGAWQGTRVVT